MDPVDTIAFARHLIDIDSTTGREGDVCQWLAAWLRERGYIVVEQPVPWRPPTQQGTDVEAVTRPERRVNLLATLHDAPAVLLSTHMDCVPPFFGSSEQGGTLRGRGACDAKGILAAQVAACERLRRAGERRVGLLFVVGEERSSDGAKAAEMLAPRCPSRFIINGEPTDGCLGAATRGVWRVRLATHGRAGHSAFPELGSSAIEKLIDALVTLRRLPLPDDPILGRTHYVVGLVSGGIAPNVIPPHAEAEVTFRTIGPPAEVLRAIEDLGPDVELEHVLDVPVEHFHTVPGFDARVFPFTTDAPFLRPFGRVMLFGPGSARVAHTDQERIAISELLAAVDDYERLVGTLLET